MKMNFYKSTFLCLAAFSVLFFALPGLAGDSTLQVKCVDASGAPVPGVKVVIAALKNLEKMKDKKSDAQGVAEFAKIDDGAYRVFGRKDGMVPALYEYALLKGAQQTVTLQFEAGADKKFYFEDPLLAQQAQALMGQALETLKQNKFADAEKLFVQSLAIHSSSPEGLYYLGVSYIQQGKYDEGLECLNKTEQVSTALATMPSPTPSGPNPYEQIVKSVQQLKRNLPGIKAEAALRNKNYEQAAKEFNEALKTNPNEPELYANLAIAYANARKFDEAITAIDKAIQLKPAEPEYPKLKTTINGRKEGAVLEKAQAILDEGNKLLQDGDAAGALKKFEESRAMVPPERQAPIWRQMGRAQAKLNQPDAAASFRKSMELAPADKVGEYRNAFAQYYLDAKKYDDAVGVLIDPKAAESQEKVLLDLARTSMNKEPKLSEAALERVIKMNPENLDAVFDLGQLYYSDGKEMDGRTKELLTRYTEKGQDATKLENAKNMLLIINRRSK